MQNLIMSLIFLGIVGYLGTALYHRAVSTEDPPVPAIKTNKVEIVYTYPAYIEIKSVEGRVLPVTLLARNSRHIHFRRKDGKEFVYLIDSLAADTRALVRQYPNVGIQDTAAHLTQSSMTLNDVYLQELERTIRKIDRQIDDLVLQSSVSRSQTEKRTLQRMIEELQVEKADFQQKISERQ